ncbi:MAG TPA: hypothetical protein VL356_11030 [Acidocella sp.]|nr:hypothetical protein [Acidocella sp.]
MKKAANFFRLWVCGGETSTAQSKKVFLLLFVHKKKPSLSLGFADDRKTRQLLP